MATVFLAEDQRLGRKVAVKRLHSDSPDDAARRFEREAKVGASLSHPNLVTVFDTVADVEGVLIVMEYVEGENLSQLMRRERLSTDQAIGVIEAIASALDYAHSAGVVHRDVKPANVLVSPDGRAKLVDLGIATATERTQITAVGTVLGTPSYMAPEQLESGQITKAVDIYALGAVAFEMLSGSKARQGRTPVEIAHQVASDPAPDLREVWRAAPPAAAAALESAMARDPRDRPATAGVLARELAEAMNGSRSRTTTATRPLEGLAGAGIPLQRDERSEAPPRSPHPGRERVYVRDRRPAAWRQALPRWIPAAGLVMVLLVVAGAIAALSGGGSDKATAPILPPVKHKPVKKPAPQQTSSQSTTTQSPATQPAPATDLQKGTQLQSQAHDLINQGRYDEAIALDQQALQLLQGQPGLAYAYALYDLGHALRLAGRPAEAIPVLEQRMKIDNQRDVVKAELEQAKKDAKGEGGDKGNQGGQGD